MSKEGMKMECKLGLVAGLVGGLALGAVFAKKMAGSRTTSSSKPKSMRLVYFNGRGLAEVSRYVLALHGVDYEDKRYGKLTPGEGSPMERLDRESQPDDALNGKFVGNMGRLPVLDVDGYQIGGSKAVARYLANAYGMLGANAKDAGLIDSVCECIFDMMEAYSKQTDKEKWHSVSSAVGHKQGERELQWYLEQIEKLVGAGGVAVGNTVSLADAYIFNKLGDRCMTEGMFGPPDSQPMGDEARLHATMQKCSPKLLKILQNFKNQPSMKRYLASRGVVLF